MNDMSSVIVPKSDQINADDLIGRDMTITIRDVQIRGGQEQPVSIYFDGSDKAFRPCKSMSRVLVYCWGPDAKQYIGRSLTLYRDANVKWGGMAVGGIRISHASHIDKDQTMVLAESKASRKPYTVKRLTGVPVAAGAPAPITLEQAELDVRAAATMPELEAVWKRKVMAPHRDALTDLLNERKADLAFDTAPTSDEALAAAILTAIADEKTSDALDSIMARRRADTDALPPELQEQVRVAYAARFDVLSNV
jgi:hypothetical protein